MGREIGKRPRVKSSRSLSEHNRASTRALKTANFQPMICEKVFSLSVAAS
jgi:hypothetical protein